jgi:5'(3')-deoxyribonucleotidase
MTNLNSLLRSRRDETRTGWIAIDVDGVLADHVSHVLPILEPDFQFSATFDQIRVWDFPINATSFGRIIRDNQKLRDFVLSTPVVEGAATSMSALYSMHHIAIVTARPAEANNWTEEWLRINAIPYDVFANLMEGTKHNTPIPCDVLVDDYVVNLREFLKNSPGRGILFSRPWNVDHVDVATFVETNRLQVALDWQDTLRIINTLF